MSFDNINALHSRFKLIFSSLIDFIIINIIFYIFIPNYEIFRIGVRQAFYISFWILISYIFDRYYQNNFANRSSNLLYQLINSFKSIFCFGLVFLIYNWILGNYISRSFLLILITNLFIFSSIFQYFINQFLFKKFIKVKFWAFCSTNESKNFLESLEFLNQNKIKFEYIENLNVNNKLINESYGIVVKDFENLTELETNKLIELKKKGIRIYKLSDWLKIFLKRYPPNLLNLKDFLTVEFLLLSNGLLMRLKRVGDILISIFLIFLSLPIIFFACTFIYIEDRGPVFYSQKRNGYLNNEFTLWKLRSMRVDAEEKGIRWSSTHDSRITKVGSFLRKTRIDELPQLWSVFSGDMSLIGPRPERPEIDKFLIEQIPFYSMRYLLRPGLSGWAQVNYPYGASVQDSNIKLSFDLYYISNYSFWLDLLIFFRTLRLIFNARGSKPYSSK